MASITTTRPSASGQRRPSYALAADGGFCIENFDAGPPFSSFLPGIAGPQGVPLWCLYVNRGQAIVSFGSHNKDNAIIEFLPANWAYQLVGIQGFRTFCLLAGDFYEPFSTVGREPNGDVKTLRIYPDRLELTATNPARGLHCEVSYFSPPARPVGALVRQVRLTNIGTERQHLALLDGLPLILPAGVADETLKGCRHIAAAYAYVQRLACDASYFATKVAVHDEAEVADVTRGNFYAAWQVENGRLQPIQPLVDPDVVFGPGQSLVTPGRFITVPEIDRDQQIWENRLACALVPLTAELEPGEAVELVGLIGAAPSPEVADRFVRSFGTYADFERAREDSKRTVAGVTAPATTVSSQPALDAYARNNFLDNVLRGGVPVALPARSGPTLLHVYTRRHGDLERDYNYFVLPPHPLSSGAGNYRDICQNRRYDVHFYPAVADRELRMFLALIQADGYNPLNIAGDHWLADDARATDCLPREADSKQHREFHRLVSRPFQPGAVLDWLERHALDVGDRDAWLHRLLGQCRRELVASDHTGGYWIDHWCYLVDLLEALASVYPDLLAEMLTTRPDIGWFDDGAFVQPRLAKYQHRPAGLRQLGAITERKPRTPPLPPVTPLAKLTALIAIKAVSFDASCRGIEMEAGRPSWDDALNGLPSLFGSSMCETLALGRLAQWLRDNLDAPPAVILPAPVANMVAAAIDHLAAREYDWPAECATREAYRETVASGSDTAQATVSAAQVARLLELVTQRVDQAATRGTDPATGLLHTYFQNTPASIPANPGQAVPDVSEPLPLFLEGQVHRLRWRPNPAAARRVYTAVRNSDLFDPTLAMYKINAPLAACSKEIGRARTFTPGWFENESVWLHMSYKYLLELLRTGLYDEFFHDATTMLVPFMDPANYGRSILENSSFIGSTANPDPATHGRGFIARLSGSTAEFVHMWLLMTVGPRPFRLDATGALTFALEPVLPGDWFTTEATPVTWAGVPQAIPADAFGCALLGHTLLVYHNDARRNTFAPGGVRPVRYQLDNNAPVAGAALGAADALRLRDRRVTRLDVWLG